MSLKLLLADDSITIQKVIGIIFCGEEYSLTMVDNGMAAVEKARELSPDVLLVDALMPGMTGYEVCEAVRAIPELATKPILILTGSFEPFDEEKAIKCGADGYLAKPFESQQIINKVKELAELGASRAAQTVAAPQSPPASDKNAAAFTTAAEPIIVPEASKSTAPSDDIWGAFTPDAEPEPAVVADIISEPADTVFSDSFEPDVFAIVNEESDSQFVQPASIPSAQPIIGTQWIPVEEHTFEFEDESVASIPDDILSEQKIIDLNPSFGEIDFEEGEPAQKVPVLSSVNIEPAVSSFIAPEPKIDSFTEGDVQMAPTVAGTGALSEEQLKAAISALSKETIERIVWEVVPDLAEALIREAIRKIKEGV